MFWKVFFMFIYTSDSFYAFFQNKFKFKHLSGIYKCIKYVWIMILVFFTLQDVILIFSNLLPIISLTSVIENTCISNKNICVLPIYPNIVLFTLPVIGLFFYKRNKVYWVYCCIVFCNFFFLGGGRGGGDTWQTFLFGKKQTFHWDLT